MTNAADNKAFDARLVEKNAELGQVSEKEWSGVAATFIMSLAKSGHLDGDEQNLAEILIARAPSSIILDAILVSLTIQAGQ